jgi:alkylhydroperoxidase family enzyme
VLQTLERISLAVAAHYRSEPGKVLTPARRARRARARRGARPPAVDLSDPREAALLRYLRPMVVDHGKPPMHLHEEAREAGWSDASLLEAIAYGGIEAFTAMINVAGEVPVDGSHEDARTLKAA